MKTRRRCRSHANAYFHGAGRLTLADIAEAIGCSVRHTQRYITAINEGGIDLNLLIEANLSKPEHDLGTETPSSDGDKPSYR